MNSSNTRRRFLKKNFGFLASIGLSTQAFSSTGKNQLFSPEERISNEDIPDNPLVLFDNFHSGNRRSYPLKKRLASAKIAGFDGYEFVMLDPASDDWKEAMDLIPSYDFKVWGLHRTTNAVVDPNAKNINRDIEQIEAVLEASATSPIEYVTLSLSGGAELRGENIADSGSVRAEDRHWERAYKIISAFDKACEKYGVRGSLYPHTHWLCDTPQSQQKILDGANVSTVGPALCSHHWYANKRSVELEEALKLPVMKNLNYVVMTNGRFSGNGFPATRFDLGEIDMAWFLAMVYKVRYTGPISSQGWAIGGDPFMSGKIFVDTMKAMRERFLEFPELYPI